MKYASSFPVIFLSAAQRLVPSDILARDSEWGRDGVWNGEYMLFRLWYVSLFLPSYTPSSRESVESICSGFLPPSSTLYIRFGGT